MARWKSRPGIDGRLDAIERIRKFWNFVSTCRTAGRGAGAEYSDFTSIHRSTNPASARTDEASPATSWRKSHKRELERLRGHRHCVYAGHGLVESPRRRLH